MPRLDAKFELVTIRLFEGDRDKLNALYPRVGYNVVIRTLVRKHLRRLDERLNQQDTPHGTELPELVELTDTASSARRDEPIESE